MIQQINTVALSTTTNSSDVTGSNTGCLQDLPDSTRGLLPDHGHIPLNMTRRRMPGLNRLRRYADLSARQVKDGSFGNRIAIIQSQKVRRHGGLLCLIIFSEW